MRKLWLTGLIGLVFTFGSLADDKKEPTVPSREEAFNKLQNDFRENIRPLILEYRNAADDAGRKAALDKIITYGEQAVQLAEKAPKDDTAFGALFWSLQEFGVIPTPRGKALSAKITQLLIDHHLDNLKLSRLLPAFIFGQPGENGDKLLKAAAEKSNSKEVKGIAHFALGMRLLKGNRQEQDEAKQLADAKQAAHYLEIAVKDYADQPLGRSTIGALAKSALFEAKNLNVGQAAPDFEIDTLDGKKAKLSDLKGKVVVLDFWATWCGPCKALIPHIREVVNRHKNDPLEFISISVDEDKTTVQDFIKGTPMPWTHWFNGAPSGGVAQQWNIMAFPTVYVIDAKGIIRSKNASRPDVMDKLIEKLLKEANSAKGS